jgi:hypothetical protein
MPAERKVRLTLRNNGGSSSTSKTDNSMEGVLAMAL